MVNWYSGDPSEDARKYVLRLCTVMYGYVTQIAIEDAETRTRPRIILDEDNLFTFPTFFFFSICTFYSLNVYPFFCYVYKPPRNASALAA